MREEDRIIVAFDRDHVQNPTIADCVAWRLDLVDDWVIADTDPKLGRGCNQRVRAIGMAETSHLAFMDDDDVYLDGALEAFRSASPDRPTVFRMEHPAIGVIWDRPELRYGNVSVQQIVVPNLPEKLGSWEPWDGRDGADFTFLHTTVSKMGEPVWRHEVVARWRPSGQEQSGTNG